ncbi:hypothetical protein [Yersinia pestis]|uniref:hypothetical protein n=1 Tax=Yersinia pestis TaxID=632 RepID=UPI000164093D|nr:hypothetical protein [Yersinia pestis]EDR51077.1 conserved hypothetical protein [Yersinia pestis biovar Antiqua str. B42003004]
MPIPERLTPGKATKNRTQRLLKLLDEISSTLEDNGDQENDRVRELILQWNEIACREHDFHEFRDFHAYTSKDDFIISAQRKAKYIEDFQYIESIELVNVIAQAEGTEPDIHYAVDLLDKNFPDGDASDLIFWPNYWFQDENMLHIELTPEETVGYLMALSGRTLQGAPEIELRYPYYN